MNGRRKPEALKYFRSFQIFKVSILKMKMYFLKNHKGHLSYKCSFQNILLCYHSPQLAMYYLEFLLLLCIFASFIDPAKPELY